MKRKRDMNLIDFGISEYAYREMVYFCMQYGEKKEALEDIYSVAGVRYDRDFIQSGKISDIVFEKAQRAQVLKTDIEIIEKAAFEAGDFLKDGIIDNVCYGIPFEYMELPCGRRQFYEKRKLFFIILNRYLIERKKG